MPTGMYLVGGSKGRPTGPELRGCQVIASSIPGVDNIFFHLALQ